MANIPFEYSLLATTVNFSLVPTKGPGYEARNVCAIQTIFGEFTVS